MQVPVQDLDIRDWWSNNLSDLSKKEKSFKAALYVAWKAETFGKRVVEEFLRLEDGTCEDPSKPLAIYVKYFLEYKLLFTLCNIVM